MRAHHPLWPLLSLMLLALGACQTPNTASCADRICPLGSVCTPSGDSCVSPDQIAGCKGLANDDFCSYAGVPDGICLDQVCYPQASCGNAVLETSLGEVCDEGGSNSDEANAACRTNCRAQACGDGIVDTNFGEDCDDGNLFPGDGCSVFCASEVCGNGLIDLEEIAGGFLPSEDCDDGANSLNHDGCTAGCIAEEPRWRSDTNGTAPSRRKSHVMTYDAARGQVLLFGGFGDFGNESDTWEWDGKNWRQRFPNNSPVFQTNAVMTYDAARGRVLLFSDASNAGISASTWEWDGADWTKMSPSVSPTVTFPAMTYDAARARVVLFGIDDTSGVQTWEWDGLEWKQLFPSKAPGYRFDHAMAYDAARARVVLFGGLGIVGGGGLNQLGDTWEWDGTDWDEITPAGQLPPERDNHAMVFDASRGRVTLFGGHGRSGSPTHMADIWEWDGVSWVQRNPPGTKPVGRNQHAMAYDSARRRLVLFGGEDQEGNQPPIDDTWEWNGDNWETGVPQAFPQIRHQHAMAYDASQGKTLLFGGLGDTVEVVLGDTWIWDGSEWFQRSGVPTPAARHQHAMAYDIARKRIVLFAGQSRDIFRDDTWEWDGAEWLQISVTAKPAGRSQHALAYDAARGQILLFGGRTVAGVKQADTWVWDGTDWTELSPTSAPSPRTGHAMAYDFVRERVVLFGGADATGPRGDTWEWDGANWTELSPNTVPASREEHKMVFDSTLGRVVFFGGSRNAGLRLNDTWEWDGTDWSRTLLSTSSPTVRSEHTMAYDAAHGRTLLFGGRNNGSKRLGDTWTFQYTSGADEACLTPFDGDGDGLVGCDDPDCWGRCTPTCPPGTTCNPIAPRCGDGVCNLALEDRRLCAQDCGAPAILCGDHYCDSVETAQLCPGDCTP